MSLTTELKQYGEIAAEQGKLALTGLRTTALAAVGAGDLLARIGPAEVRGYLQSATDQAVSAYGDLSRRGAEVVHEFRKDPRVQRVILRAERTVDVVEDSLEDLLEEAGEAVIDATDAAVEAGERTRANARTATKKAETAVAEGAERTRSTVRKTAARNTNARKATATTPPVRKAPARKRAPRTAASTS